MDVFARWQFVAAQTLAYADVSLHARLLARVSYAAVQGYEAVLAGNASCYPGTSAPSPTYVHSHASAWLGYCFALCV